jgi:ParB family transcriptional regulator, chromosome partitioning protein
MPKTGNSSSSPDADNRLAPVLLERLHPHPLNANVMAEDQLQKLERNIMRNGGYPPLVVRPHPELQGQYQLLDGEQRWKVLRGLGQSEALCFIWPCDDATALLLLSTLNRLRGEDVPVRRAELLAELSGLLSVEDLALLLPEDEGQLRDTLDLLELDPDKLMAELEEAAQRRESSAPRLISFAVLPEDEEVIERAIEEAASSLNGANRRGRALAVLARSYLEGGDA